MIDSPRFPLTRDDLVAVITQGATHALLDVEPQAMVKVMAHYDALMTAFKGWRLVSMLDLSRTSPVPAKDPFAWFLFRHETQNWWAAYDTDAECLSHPYTGEYIHTHLVRPGGLTVGLDEESFATAAYDRATMAQYQAGQMVDPSVRDQIHARWILGHLHDQTAQAYLTLLALQEVS